MAPAVMASSPYLSYIRDVPDFPKPGIVFKDITPLLSSPEALRGVIGDLTDQIRPLRPTLIAGVESRGFLMGAPIADRLGIGLIPLRKPGKLPWETLSESYELEYGKNFLDIHVDAAGPGDRVVLVDDLLATGGTAGASIKLIRRLGAEVVAAAFVIELKFLGGRSQIHGPEVISLIPIED